MDTVLAETWTIERFLTWEGKQEGRHEFDGRIIVPMTGGTVAHQDILLNLCFVLRGLLADRPLKAVPEMRLRSGISVRYPDVVICPVPLDQTTGTLTDALAIFEILSADTATTDRVDKLIEYATLASPRCYILVEQTAIAATVFQRDPGGSWIATAHTSGTLPLAALDLEISLVDLYRGLSFAR